MRLFGKSKEEKIVEFKNEQSMRNGKELKNLLKIFKENRDEIEKRTGKRPDIDDTTKLFMQKILNVWLSEGKDIDDEKFWNAVDYNKQFDYPVGYYEKNSEKGFDLDYFFTLLNNFCLSVLTSPSIPKYF